MGFIWSHVCRGSIFFSKSGVWTRLRVTKNGSLRDTSEDNCGPATSHHQDCYLSKSGGGGAGQGRGGEHIRTAPPSRVMAQRCHMGSTVKARRLRLVQLRTP